MQQDQPTDSTLRFGVFELDLRSGELRKRGLRIRLQDQPCQVLTILLQHAGELVTREELQKRIWPADTLIDSDHGLNKAINKIREALSDSAESPRFVETVARRGYRFIAEVQHKDAESVASGDGPVPPAAQTDDRDSRSDPKDPRRSARDAKPLAWALPIAGLLLLVGGFVAWRGHVSNRTATPRVRSLAVLPFESLSSDASQDYFADGMTDELISDLGQISALRVISRTSVMAYKRARKPLPEIARELKVDAVVEGTVLRSGDQVRITAQLIDASADQHLWSQSYEGELRETLALQNKVARAIADAIRINVSPREQAALQKVKMVTPEAYESYLKGRYFWNKRSAEGLKVALSYFQQSIEEDSSYAPAYSGLSDTYALLADWEYGVMTPKEAFPKAKAAASLALALDGSLGEAHNSLAFCLDAFDWDWENAGKEFQRAIELNPGYATAHHWYASHLLLLGQPAEAIAEVKKAANLDPLSLIITADLAEALLLAHSYDESIGQSQKAIQLDSNFALAHNQLGQAYLQKQRNNEALGELQKAVELSGGSPICMANLARAYIASGKGRDAVKLLEELKGRPNPAAPEIAMVYAALGDADQSLKWLEKGYQERFNPSVLMRSGFDPIRAEPRFQELLRRIGLPR